MRFRLLVQALVCASLWLGLGARSASAERPAATVLLLAAPDDPAAMRLRAELGAIQLRVICVRPEAQPSSAFLEGLAREYSANAVVRWGAPSGPEVWVFGDAARGATRLEAPELDAKTLANDDEVVPRRIAELLRSALLDSSEPTPTTPLPRPAQPAQESAVVDAPVTPPSIPRLALAVGPAFTVSGGGSGFTGDVLVAGDWFATRWLGVRAFALIPVIPSRVSTPEGSASNFPALAGAGPELLFAHPGAPLIPRVGVGAALGLFRSTGTAAAPQQSGSGNVFLGLFYAGGGLSARLSSQLRVGVDASFGVAVPEVGIDFAGREIATWGHPVMIGSALLELVVP